jgi:tRNA pseudouridine55 synthase
MNGVLIIDKPQGLTSHDVVSRVRRLAQERSVGHLGTLDPMATGVLPLVLGNFTRLAQFYLGAAKTYEGEIRFGFATDTYDAEGQPADLGDGASPVTLNLTDIREAATHFSGAIRQVPPPFSAKKIAGVPAYKLARKKKEVSLEAVTVEVHELEILALDDDRARFRARVSAGTYLRSIAHDMGIRLGMGAHLSALRRIAVAEFDCSQAVTLDAFAAAAEQGRAAELLIHPRRVLAHMPCVTATEASVSKIRNGQPVNLPEMSRAPLVKVFASQTELVAIATRIAGTLFHPKVVFSAS